jgi:hypothetical protein
MDSLFFLLTNDIPFIPSRPGTPSPAINSVMVELLLRLRLLMLLLWAVLSEAVRLLWASCPTKVRIIKLMY